MENYNLLPADTFTVINRTLIYDKDYKLITNLYQPIIGAVSTSLYFTMCTYLDKTELTSSEWTHHHLMANMGVSLVEIKQALEKLEATGLIKTFIKEDSVNNYIYELYSPLSAYEYLGNPILSTTLYNTVGNSEYKKIVEFYKVPKINLLKYKNISKSMTEVFGPLPTDIGMHIETEIRKQTKRKIELTSKIDLDSVLALIPNEVLNMRSLTKDIKEYIINIGFIYNLDTNAASEVIRSSIDEKKTIDKKLMLKNARNYYKFENDGKLPSLVYKNQPLYLKSKQKDASPLSKMIYQFETYSPYEYLCLKNNGGTPSKSDKLILEYLLLELKLTPGVVNVLIDYVLRINNNKLTKNYIEAIGSQWARSNIKTVMEAIELSKKEMSKKGKVTTKKAVSKPTKPDWYNQDINSNKASSDDINELEEMMKNLKLGVNYEEVK